MDDSRPSDTETGPSVPDTRPARRLQAVRPSDPGDAPTPMFDRPDGRALTTDEHYSPDRREVPPFQQPADPPRSTFTVKLPERFADWLRRRAAAHRESPEHHAAGLLRTAWQNDEWRQRQEATLTGPGEGAGSFRR